MFFLLLSYILRTLVFEVMFEALFRLLFVVGIAI